MPATYEVSFLSNLNIWRLTMARPHKGVKPKKATEHATLHICDGAGGATQSRACSAETGHKRRIFHLDQFMRYKINLTARKRRQRNRARTCANRPYIAPERILRFRGTPMTYRGMIRSLTKPVPDHQDCILRQGAITNLAICHEFYN